ncbi:hypothetical protein, partial [Oceaniserpentilla sp. 4NH20-0058]|uniref:hypothetical protein n=1 Tax=Oceaniserpentilla sp. 4NH20-0058 TaxID=3127660 RepID=UPI00333FA1AF
RSNVGGLAGYARSNNTLEANTMMGSVESIYSGDADTGGLVGFVNFRNIIRANLVSGRVAAEGDNVGGLIGFISNISNTVEGNLSSVWVEGSINLSTMGGLVGGARFSQDTLQNNYWATDASGQLTSHLSSEANSYVGLELATLRCGVMANTDYANSNCVSEDGAAEGLSGPVTVFKDWDTYGVTDTNGVFQPYWDFGSNQQLPALNLNGIIHRDSDGDGVADNIDVYPLSFAAS